MEVATHALVHAQPHQPSGSLLFPSSLVHDGVKGAVWVPCHLPPLHLHPAVNVVPGGKGMGLWHSTISQLLAGVAFVDNLKSIQSEIIGTILLFSSAPLKITPTDREKYFYNFVMFATQIPSIGQKQFFQAAAQKSACTHMQQIQKWLFEGLYCGWSFWIIVA